MAGPIWSAGPELLCPELADAFYDLVMLIPLCKGRGDCVIAGSGSSGCGAVSTISSTESNVPVGKDSEPGDVRRVRWLAWP